MSWPWIKYLCDSKYGHSAPQRETSTEEKDVNRGEKSIKGEHIFSNRKTVRKNLEEAIQ